MESNSQGDNAEVAQVLHVNHFIDIVKNQKSQYDTLFSLKVWRPNPMLYVESTNSVTDSIVNSVRVKDVIEKVKSLFNYIQINY